MDRRIEYTANILSDIEIGNISDIEIGNISDIEIRNISSAINTVYDHDDNIYIYKNK